MRHAEALGTVYDMEQSVSIYHASFAAFKDSGRLVLLSAWWPGDCSRGLLSVARYPAGLSLLLLFLGRQESYSTIVTVVQKYAFGSWSISNMLKFQRTELSCTLP